MPDHDFYAPSSEVDDYYDGSWDHFDKCRREHAARKKGTRADRGTYMPNPDVIAQRREQMVYLECVLKLPDALIDSIMIRDDPPFLIVEKLVNKVGVGRAAEVLSQYIMSDEEERKNERRRPVKTTRCKPAKRSRKKQRRS